MAKIILNYLHYLKQFLFSTILLFIISCSSVEMVSIKNATSDPLQFHGKFEFKPHDPFDLNFTLKPEGVDLWRYEVGYFEKKI